MTYCGEKNFAFLRSQELYGGRNTPSFLTLIEGSETTYDIHVSTCCCFVSLYRYLYITLDQTLNNL